MQYPIREPENTENPKCATDERLNVVLIAPFGLQSQVHPWGIHLLKRAVGSLRPNADAHVWEMYRDPVIKEVFARHQGVIRDVRPWIVRRAKKLAAELPTPWVSDVTRWEVQHNYFAAVSLALGTEVLQEVVSRYSLRRLLNMRGIEAALRTYREDVSSCITKYCEQFIDGSRQTIFGISCYDGTLMNVLWIAQLLRARFPGASIVLGGEAMDPATARSVCSALQWIDGIVVGFGEAPLLSMIDGLGNGEKIRELRVPGLFTATHTPPPEAEYGTDKVLKSVEHGLAYRSESTGRIHIFARRGCGWGRCTFCSGNFRRKSLDADLEVICEEVTALLDALGAADREHPEPIHVRFDNENNDAVWMYKFLEFLEQQAEERERRFVVFFWMTARQLAHNQNYRLFRQWRNIKLDCTVGIETFNPTNLRNMRKGVDVLTLLMCLKMVADSGGANLFNYFAYFPLEDGQSVRQELEILTRTLHLFAPSKAPVFLLSYQPSSRDEIFANQTKFGVTVSIHNDVWLRRAFGLCLPIGYGVGASFVLTPSGNSEYRTKLWHDIVYKHFNAILDSLRLLRLQRGILHRVGLYLRAAAGGFTLALTLLRMWIGSLRDMDFAYVRRTYVFVRYIIFPRRKREPTLSLNGNLVTRANFPGAKSRNGLLKLEPVEVAILRYAYMPRGCADVVGSLAAKYGKVQVERAIQVLSARQLVLVWKHRMLSLVHDPDQLKVITSEMPSLEVSQRRAAGSASDTSFVELPVVQ